MPKPAPIPIIPAYKHHHSLILFHHRSRKLLQSKQTASPPTLLLTPSLVRPHLTEGLISARSLAEQIKASRSLLLQSFFFYLHNLTTARKYDLTAISYAHTHTHKFSNQADKLLNNRASNNGIWTAEKEVSRQLES